MLNARVAVFFVGGHAFRQTSINGTTTLRGDPSMLIDFGLTSVRQVAGEWRRGGDGGLSPWGVFFSARVQPDDESPELAGQLPGDGTFAWVEVDRPRGHDLTEEGALRVCRPA